MCRQNEKSNEQPGFQESVDLQAPRQSQQMAKIQTIPVNTELSPCSAASIARRSMPKRKKLNAQASKTRGRRARFFPYEVALVRIYHHRQENKNAQQQHAPRGKRALI